MPEHQMAMQEAESLPPGYRMTELGPLPEAWRVVRLGEAFDIQQGKALSRKKDQGSRPRPFLQTANVFWGRIDLSNLDQMATVLEWLGLTPAGANQIVATIGEALKGKGEEVLRLCTHYGARKPRVFGSVARGGADVESGVVPRADFVEFLKQKRHYCKEAIRGVEGGRQ